jgi:2-methylcitrate dehydratase PrpD
MTTPPTLAQQVAQVAHLTMETGLSHELRHASAMRVLDVLGNSFAAADLPVVHSMRTVVDGWGGNAQATAINSHSSLEPTNGKTNAPNAALLNGTMAHALDFDDTHLPSVLHPSASVVPAAISIAELTGASGTQLLDAIIMGIEVTCRLGMAGYDRELGNSIFFEHGLHATSITGTMGAAVAGAMLLQSDPDQIASALGIAASMGAGLLEANRTGGTVKRLHCGWAAHAGVVAAQSAYAGITGPPTVLEGRFGFLQAFLGDRAVESEITENLGDQWVVPGLFYKPYPCNHFTHAGIDAARELRARGINPSDIHGITLGVPTPVLRTIAEPVEAKAQPESGYHAAFSGPFTLASAWFSDEGLGVFHDDFTDEKVKDPDRLALAAKVTCVASPTCDDIFPYQFPAIVNVTLHDGSIHTAKILTNRGGPDRPLSDAELDIKFLKNCERTIPTEHAEKVRETVYELVANAATVNQLGRLLQGPAA